VAAYEMGMTYERIGHVGFNASTLWQAFREPWDQWHAGAQLQPAAMKATLANVEALGKSFETAPMGHPDADLLRAEFVFTCQEICHALKRELARQVVFGQKKKVAAKVLARLASEAAELGEAYESLWLARNKRSRLKDVLVHFTRLKKEYQRAARGR
jgi:hypothetical protein